MLTLFFSQPLPCTISDYVPKTPVKQRQLVGIVPNSPCGLFFCFAIVCFFYLRATPESAPLCQFTEETVSNFMCRYAPISKTFSPDVNSPVVFKHVDTMYRHKARRFSQSA